MALDFPRGRHVDWFSLLLVSRVEQRTAKVGEQEGFDAYGTGRVDSQAMIDASNADRDGELTLA